MWFFCPAFADVFAGREASEGLEPLGEIVGRDEVGEVFTQLVVGFVIEAFDGRFLDRPVHAFDLAVGPRMLGLGGAMIDVVPGAGVFKGVRHEAFATGDRFFD